MIPTASDHPSWRRTAGPLVAAHDAVLLDLDGVVYVGDQAVEGAVRAVAAVRQQGRVVAFVTNNAARSPDVVARHLNELGVAASADDVVTSAQAAAALLRSTLPEGARVLAVGAEGLWAALRAVGLRPVAAVADEPVAVVQGFSPDTTWHTLLEACVAVRSGLPWVATNLDATLPTPRGAAPGNGAFVEVVRRTTGVEPQVAGKPFRPLMEEAVSRTGAQRALVVGDRLDTDLAGARAAGLPGLLVLTGVSGTTDLLTAPPALRPDHLAADLGGLLTTHDAPAQQAGWWVEGRVRGRWGVGALEMEVQDGVARGAAAGGGSRTALALAVVRVACAAVWQHADAGRGDVDVARVLDVLRPWTAPVGFDR